jgi:SAM-dependent MidA family methyltransferase
VSEEVAARLREAIAAHGPISFAEFMEIALYSPGGFYDRPPVGERGHFVTSPHVHDVFGTLLAGALRSFWDGIGRPAPFPIVELGAGDGTLARRLLSELEPIPLDYTAIERSAGARQRLGELPVRVATSLELLDRRVVGCILANELLDNLPFEWVRRTEESLVQVFVGVSGDRFVAIERPWPDELDELAPDLQVGQEAVVSIEAHRTVERVAGSLARGYALFIDYGEGHTAQVHGYRDHRVIADVLAEPGSADITAGVDLESLARHAERYGMRSLGPFSQRSALIALGIADWFERQRVEQAKLLDERAGLEAIRTYGGRSRASLLVDPSGLGRLRWLLLATAECEWPAWARDAAEAPED